MSKKPRYRISFDIDEELYFRSLNALPWGIRNQLYRIITRDLLQAINKHGLLVAYGIISGQIKLLGSGGPADGQS